VDKPTPFTGKFEGDSKSIVSGMFWSVVGATSVLVDDIIEGVALSVSVVENCEFE
jgi:hypothetical protein